MTSPLLLKGFEVELFTGLPSGQNVGVASDVAAALNDFVTEPDCRNVEYITAPIAEYRQLSEALLQPRRRLRTWLASRNLTLLPGSTLSLGDSSCFERSDPENPYHSFIESDLRHESCHRQHSYQSRHYRSRVVIRSGAARAL